MTYEELMRKSPTHHAIYWWMVQHPGRWMRVCEFTHALQFRWSNVTRRWFARNWPEWSPETRRKGLSLQIRVVRAAAKERGDIASVRRARIDGEHRRLIRQLNAEADAPHAWARMRPYQAPKTTWEVFG